MATTELTRSRLADAIDARRVELRMELGELAKEAGMSSAHLRRIRNSEHPITPLRAAGLEDALRWERGSVEAVRAGGNPSPLGQAPLVVGRDPDKTLGALLLERGLARPEDLDASDEVKNDPVAWEIIELEELSEQARGQMLQAYASMRRAAFQAARSQRKRPRA